MIRSHKELLIRYSINQGMHCFSMGIVIPVMILALLDLGFNIGQVGIAMAVMGTTVLVLELPTGGLSDTLGRKRVYIIAVVFYIAGYLLILAAGTFIILLAAVILIGTGRALSSGSIDAWFVDEHKRLGGDDRHLQKDLAVAGVVIPMALGAGTLAGGIIPDISGTIRTNIVVLILLYIVQIFLTLVVIKERTDSFSKNLADGFLNFPHVLGSAMKYGIRQRNVFAILLATAALGIGLSGLEQLWQPHIRNISPGTGTWVLGLLATGYFVSAAVGNALSSRILNLAGNRYVPVLLSFRLLMGVFYILLSFSTRTGSFAPIYFILLFTHGITESPEMTVYNRDIPSDKRSSLLSLNSLFLQAGGAAGAVAAGQIALKASIPAAWVLSGGLLALSAFFYLLIREPSNENKIQSRG